MDSNANLEYINIYKNEYIIEYKSGNLIINKTSCYKVSREVAFLISYLPNEAKKETYISCLSSLGIKENENIFNKLNELGVLTQKQEVNVIHRIKMIVNKIFNPQITILSSKMQKRLLEKLSKLKFIENKNMNLDLMIKIMISFMLSLFASGFFVNNLLKTKNLPMASSNFDGILLFLFIFLGIIVHEMGHSFMCNYCGIGLRSICFTVFLFYPAMFTNVSGIEEMNLKQRILINISGLCAQGLYMVFLIVLYFSTGYYNFLIAVKLLFDMFYFNLYPFVRTDGYWLFKDILFFYKNSKMGKNLNNIYYTLYLLSSAYIGYSGFIIIKSLVLYFMNFKAIRLNSVLLINLFYLYLITTFIKAIKNKFMEFHKNFIKDNKQYKKSC